MLSIGYVNNMIITSQTPININENFKVEAGPGAGKTQFLINHINQVLQKSDILYCTRKIACITYTNTAVETILSRLGTGGANRVDVITIHSFLYNNVVKPYCTFIPPEYSLNIQKVKGHDEPYVNSKYIRDWLDQKTWQKLKHPNSKQQLLKMPTLNKALQNWLLSMKCSMKNGNIVWLCDNNKAKAIDKATGKYISINANALNLLKDDLVDYKKLYWMNGKLDHEDILYFSYVLIKEYPFILTVLQAKYPYFFIDEFQDTNPIQSYLIDEIKKSGSIVGVIGDSAQSIYGFQGANLSLYKKFKVAHDNTHTIVENHRSTNQIVSFLNVIRNDIVQEVSEKREDIRVTVIIGKRNKAYLRAKEICDTNIVVTLSRDNITSNAMKELIEESNLDKNFISKYIDQESNTERKNYITSFINAIELAKNMKLKEALKKISWIYRNEDSPKKKSLYSLFSMVKRYDEYNKGTLMDFYTVLCDALKIKLSGFRAGAIKNFYEDNTYKKMAMCINIVEDVSNHITIHKSKGAEFENVLVIGNADLLKFLLEPDLNNNEEHRIYYVAMSRAQRKLFIQFDDLSEEEENKLRLKYNIQVIKCNED